ncbi:D-alanyl-D-alanine carboxypeptidase family protein [Catenulispora subtropica]|uniref:Serine hydrolase n=1 Tax=Catenulispora subtropica TaxID=450798 RepID=A0ABN2ST05_9ACTN
MPNRELEEQSASETPEAAEPAKPRRRGRRRIAAAGGGVLVLGGAATIAVLAVNGSGGPPKPDLARVPPDFRTFASALPWPTDGETALWADGVGDLGTCGKQTAVPIASVAKVMTAYVVLRDHPLTGTDPGPDITVDDQAGFEAFSRDESSAPVRSGQRISERTLLELMMVPSANNVARLLARWDAGSEPAFVAEMNAAAAGLGMTDTVYTDAAGFDAATRSTAADQLKLAESALTDSTLLNLTAQHETRVPDDPTLLPNTDSLLGTDGVVGGKTGSSTPAGGALMWAAHRTIGGRDRLVLGVVLHQNAGTTSEQGLARALTVSRRLIAALG